MEQQQLFKTRDKRKKDWFWLNNQYLNGFGKILGAGAIAVYVSLCRHSDEDEKCFPAQKTIAEETGLSERKVRNIIKDLEKLHIIKITKERSRQGKWLNNTYWLLDKSEWLSPEAHSASGEPEAKNDKPRSKKRQTQRHPVPLNNTNKNNTNENNTNESATQSVAASPGKEINELIELFKPINPTYERLFANKTQREALERLTKKFGKEKVESIIKSLAKIFGKPYAPRITTPYLLEQKLADLVAYLQQERSRPPKGITIRK